MRCYLLTLLISLLFIVPIKAQEHILTDTQRIMGLSRLWEGVRSNFVYYDQLKFDWDSLYEASIPKVIELKDTYSYLRELESIAASVKDGHTFVYHNGNVPRIDRISPAPFTTQYIEGKVFVDKIWSSLLVDKGIKRGSEVVAVNGINVVSYAEEVLGKFIPSSTPQWTHYKTFSNYELTKGRRTMPLTISFEENGKSLTVPIDRDMNWDLKDNAKKNNNGKDTERKYQSIEYQPMEGNIGLLTVRDFMNDSMRKDFDELYLKILTSSALIIDLRNNEGGRSGYSDYILRHLIDKPIKTSSWTSRMYIPTHASWNYGSEWYSRSSDIINPINKDIYMKPVLVLVNEGTFSAAEDFCVRFRSAKRGLILGSPTGGSTGNGVQITLIEGLAWANICAKKDVAPDGTVFVGVGVLPDVEISPTRASFLSDTDLVLEGAIDWIKNSIKSN